MYYGQAWATDNRTFFYVRPDDAMRPYQVWRHTLGTPVGEDALVFQEDDDAFYVSVVLEKDEQVILIQAGSKVTDECWFVPADDPTAAPKVIQPRIQDLEYNVDHHGDRFFITTNHEAVNSRLMEAPDSAPGIENWREVIPHHDDVKLNGIDVFADYIALLRTHRGAAPHPLDAPVRRRDPDDRAARGGVHGGAERQPRVRLQDHPLQLHVARHADDHLRLRHRGAHARPA